MMDEFSQHGEQEIIFRFFGDKATGLFIDIGAGDGVTDSNSRALFMRGWSGILIEASRQRFAQLLALYASEPRVTLLYAAVGRTTGPSEFYECSETLNWSSADTGWIKSCGGTFVNMPAFHFRLPDLNLPMRPDFLTIDTEGFDSMIICSMAQDFKPALILAEIDKGDAGREINMELTKRGYKLYDRTLGNAFYAL